LIYTGRAGNQRRISGNKKQKAAGSQGFMLCDFLHNQAKIAKENESSLPGIM